MTEHKEVDDFVVQELIDIYLYQAENPCWGKFQTELLEQGYDSADVWKILTRVREGDI